MVPKKITVSVISDLTTDQRVIRISSSLQQMGFSVTVIARSFSDSLPLDEYVFKAKRIHCIFRKGFLQYAEFNLKLFFSLLFTKTDYLLANDLDVLLPNYMISKLRRKKIFYDTHEYFTGVPELKNSPTKRKIWKWIEDRIFPKLPVVYTVNDSVKNTYEKEYGIREATIFALSADALPEHKATAQEVGVNKYLTKPISKMQFIQSLAEAERLYRGRASQAPAETLSQTAH